ncbi:transposase [Bythopirellula polymerisocia]|uniref:Transposase IS204/IS1001/IS1096/IS1165 DDE domain-containing protein n=1 Tax=Bythopirellula polymerisocia TaxID=2528003 RepID=A0A5C6CYS0_9BACT|nr:transposase [Bythopirellula polymerisocia]TWU28687.1 hypothetical protein Pla144_19790 [Bythopirellula polymerisocia]
MKAEGYEQVFKRSRWCLLKRPENLTDQQTIKLSELLRYILRSVRAHLLREDFQRFWEYGSPGLAPRLPRFCWACREEYSTADRRARDRTWIGNAHMENDNENIAKKASNYPFWLSNFAFSRRIAYGQMKSDRATACRGCYS